MEPKAYYIDKARLVGLVEGLMITSSHYTDAQGRVTVTPAMHHELTEAVALAALSMMAYRPVKLLEACTEAKEMAIPLQPFPYKDAGELHDEVDILHREMCDHHERTRVIGQAILNRIRRARELMNAEPPK